MKKKTLTITILMAVILSININSFAQELLKNANFANWENGKPVSWTPASNKQKVLEGKANNLEGAVKTLSVEIITDGGKGFGEIRQTVKITPNTEYQFSGWQKSTTKGTCFFMIKLRAGRKEIKRIKLGSSKIEWEKIEKIFNSAKADNIQVLCRYRQKPEFIGTKCYWRKLKLTQKK